MRKIRFLINCETDSWEWDIPETTSLPLKGDYVIHNGETFVVVQRTWFESFNDVDVEILLDRP